MPPADVRGSDRTTAEEWQALERRDLDRRAGVINVLRTISDGEVVELAKTNVSRRQVPLSRRAIAALDAIPPRLSTPLIFPAPKAGLLNLDNFRRRQLDAPDDVVAAATGAVVVPLAVDEAAGDGDRAAFGQVLRARVGLGAEGRDVDEQRLVLLVVDRKAQLADLAVVLELLEDRVGGQVSDQRDLVNGGS